MRSLLPFRRPRGQNAPQKSRGQSLVEFALILPVFLVFLAAALDLGRVYYANISLNNAAREGAFEAAKHPASFGAGQTCDASDPGRVVCRVQLESRSSAITVADGDISATCSNPGCGAAYGSTVTVKVTGSFQLVTPILSAIFGGQSVPLRSSATAQVEYYPPTTPATPPPAPSADFTTSNTRVCSCPSLTINFTDLSTGSPSAWEWNFGDGSSSTDQNPTHDFGPGDWDVSLTAINITDSSTNTKHTYVRVNVTPTPTPTPAPTPSPGATPTPTPAPTPSPTPWCGHPPNVMGQTPGTAVANITNAGLRAQSDGTLTSGPKNKVQAQNPDATQIVCTDALIVIKWRPS